MDKNTLERIEKLEEVIDKLFEELEIKTEALRRLYEENVRRLREQNQPKGMDTR